MVVVLAGIILYALLKGRREHQGQAGAPAASSSFSVPEVRS
jgi:hypothetical protein